MATEQKIKEAFEASGLKNNEDEYGGNASWEPFRAGYLALLNSLEQAGEIPWTYSSPDEPTITYRLPEGVTKP